MGGWGGYEKATKMRDIVKRIVVDVVESIRPAPSYGKVISIDRPNRVCLVKYRDDDDDPIPVSMASIQPSRPGQIIRVEGTLGDRYVADVIGESVVIGSKMLGEMFEYAGAPANIAWALPTDGRAMSTSTYAALFQEIGYRHGGSGTTFNLPSSAAANTNVTKMIRVL